MKPHDVESAVLSAMLLGREQTVIGLRKLNQQDFASPKNRAVFSLMKQLYEEKTAVDLVTVMDRAKDDLKAYINDISDIVYTDNNMDDHIGIVKDRSIAKQMKLLGKEIESECASKKNGVDILESIEKRIIDISSQKISKVEKVSDFAEEFEEDLMARKNRKVTDGIRTGLPSLDQRIGVIEPGIFGTIAARPSFGKTSLATQMITYNAKKGKSVLFLSLEQSKNQIMRRMMANDVEMDSKKMKMGWLTSEDVFNISKALQDLSDTNLFIDSNSSTLMDIEGKATEIDYEHGLDLVVVDYITLIQTQETGLKKLETLSKGLKNMAKKLRVPIIALSQLSRAPENRAEDDHRPKASDLYGGVLEHDLDLMLSIYQPFKYTGKDEDKGVAEILVNKNRDGETGYTRVQWIPEYTKFVDNY